MPREGKMDSLVFPPENLRGLKGLITCNNKNKANYNNFNCGGVATEDIINDCELALRKAGEAASRRYEAVEWLRKMEQGASEVLPKEPSEEEFCLALRNGLILCNVLNKVNPGAVLKVVENPVIDVDATEGAAQSAIQYFENMRNFLVAVGDMKLLTFEASDLEKGGSSNKVVDCILCLKGYFEWMQAGGIGVWRYGGTVKITSLRKESPSTLFGSESADDSFDESESSQYEDLLELLQFSGDVSLEESKIANELSVLFDRFALGLLQAYLADMNGFEELPLNSMVLDTVIRNVTKKLLAVISSQGNQLGHHFKKLLQGDGLSLSKSEFLEAIKNYLHQRTSLVASDNSRLCICGGKYNGMWRGDANFVDKDKVNNLQRKQEELESSFKETKLEVQQAHLTWKQELDRLVNHTKSLELAASSYHKVLEENRLLHNQVLDLKGTIRVYCRVKPVDDAKSTVEYIGENGDIMIVNPHKQGKDSRRIYSFNKVFGANVTQQQIYVDTQPLIRSVLDGYNVCIFAYGQTGSGKTYTMSGPDLTTQETWGVNYRALRDLFEISKERADAIEYEVGVQMIEIYNEQVRDLLVISSSNRRLEIRNNSQLNGLNVPDASLVPVKCPQDVLDLMEIGLKNRAVGATALNVRSSRSHSILTIHVRGKDLVSGSILKGCLHLVDLAGSERVDKSEAVGERLKEAQHINRSLSALGDVIAALAQKSTHIPYRNSKLTQVLQESLGGHAKTLMFVHITPEVNAIGETISTLKFAERVGSIELGAARSNKETGELRDIKEGISHLKLALEKKEAELEQLRKTNLRGASPLRVPRQNITANLKPDLCQQTVDHTKDSEIRSCSSGKQRKYRLPSKFTDKDILPKLSFLPEERSTCSGKPRSPSPPIRRSISTDRGALMRSRGKLDTTDNRLMKLQFPPKASINKSFATILDIQSTETNKKGCSGIQDNIYDASSRLQKVKPRKFLTENEEDQFKQALNVRQGGVRKSKADSMAKAKHQLPAKVQKSDFAVNFLSVVNSGGARQEIPKSDFSEPENEQKFAKPLTRGNIKAKKFHQDFSRDSQYLESRDPAQALDSTLPGVNENKISNNILWLTKEGSTLSKPESKRSRSSPRGKFVLLP
ncbi:kinesin-like protein KIN-14F [Heracleum sosnowskyi]|uniref:Kinesin-like protein KIN-14F n=1 Tax=Heracleum sosnowskyi TaxID=360622 RepID=A0AAD8NDJ9_9APIA|nr:kinesin-like protein KIN-14F [Heracleum sosnowskyi]